MPHIKQCGYEENAVKGREIVCHQCYCCECIYQTKHVRYEFTHWIGFKQPSSVMTILTQRLKGIQIFTLALVADRLTNKCDHLVVTLVICYSFTVEKTHARETFGS